MPGIEEYSSFCYIYDSLSNRKTSEQRSKNSEEVNHVKIQGKSISDRGNKHKDLV